ncbi:MAG: hypothetical protein AB7I37_19485 [Pirellulales bacterium]
MNTNQFNDRRRIDPQGVIDDLLAQTTRQAVDVHRLNGLLTERDEEILLLRDRAESAINGLLFRP